jgi:hypothetical protein
MVIFSLHCLKEFPNSAATMYNLNVKFIQSPATFTDLFDSPSIECIGGRVCLRLKIDPPYPFQIPTQELNELGLLEQELYTTGDIGQILGLHPYTFRYRLRSGIYPEAKQRAGDKRRFTYDEVAEIMRITKAKSWPKYKSKC